MLINLSRAIFRVDPDSRFAKTRGVDPGVLNDLFIRQQNLKYSLSQLQEFYLIRTGKQIHRANLATWLKLVEVYRQAQPAIRRGAQQVTLDFFSLHRDFILRELTKND